MQKMWISYPVGIEIGDCISVYDPSKKKWIHDGYVQWMNGDQIVEYTVPGGKGVKRA